MKLEESSPVDAMQYIIERCTCRFWNVDKNKKAAPMLFTQSILTGSDGTAESVKQCAETFSGRPVDRTYKPKSVALVL